MEWNLDVYLLIEMAINLLTLLFLVQTMSKRVVEQQRERGIHTGKWSHYVKPSAFIVSFIFVVCLVFTLIVSELDGTKFIFLHPMLIAGIFLFWKMDNYASIINRALHENDDSQ